MGKKVTTLILFCDRNVFYVQVPIDNVNFSGSYQDEVHYLNSITFRNYANIFSEILLSSNSKPARHIEILLT